MNGVKSRGELFSISKQNVRKYDQAGFFLFYVVVNSFIVALFFVGRGLSSVSEFYNLILTAKSFVPHVVAWTGRARNILIKRLYGKNEGCLVFIGQRLYHC